jgi:hypothetical protein
VSERLCSSLDGHLDKGLWPGMGIGMKESWGRWGVVYCSLADVESGSDARPILRCVSSFEGQRDILASIVLEGASGFRGGTLFWRTGECR